MRQCDFNIHAYDFDNEQTKEKQNSYVFERPKGQIEGTVAQTICAASHIFQQTRRIQEQLTSSLILRNYVSNRNQLVENNICTNWQWNTCYGCSKFTSVNCHSVLLNSSKLHSLRQTVGVAGEHDAAPNQHPYTVRIAKQMDSRVDPIACGGVIYNSWYVLTTAYCVHKLDPCSLTVIAGDHSVSHIEGSEQFRRVVAIISHEKFVRDTNRDNDIAILKVESPFNFTTNVQPVLLANKEYSTTNIQQVEMSGWGEGRPDVLQTIVIPFVDDCDCRLQYSYKDRNSITQNKICMGAFGNGPCEPDKGNPITVTENNTKYLVGIASFSNVCGNSPGVATKVFAYREWISLRAG